MDGQDFLPPEWERFLKGSIDEAALAQTLAKVRRRRMEETVYPPEGKIFRALQLIAPEDVKVVILGQDPYHEPDQAEGLAFSVPSGVAVPPSLRNIFKEYSADLGREIPATSHLGAWAAGGVLLINAVLSVDAGNAGSHRNYGWEKFTDALIAAVSSKLEKVVFILWGGFAARKVPLINHAKHLVITSAHPSPLSAYRGFFGSKPFSQAENFLQGWRWPEL